jgi:lysyl-tRNA synthetase class 1
MIRDPRENPVMPARDGDAAPWPVLEAQALLQRVGVDGGDPVMFETGYGPSGLPHIGTFAEVARTTFVRRAFEGLSSRPTKLVAFSDDMDGLRKVPLNVPDRERMSAHLGKPLSAIPDPFGGEGSWSDMMNGKLREFLDSFGFDYEFRSSTAQYRAGVFDRGLQILLDRVDEVLAVILPTLREENRDGWSPFMVICPSCGRNLCTTVTAYHPRDGEVSYRCDGRHSGGLPGCGREGRSTVMGGRAKVGWKVDWALRWFTFGIDYEMYGKDLIESATLSSRIVKVMGGRPPQGYFYEMFLDEDGKKISKSIGKGISVDTWQEYAPIGALLAFLYQNPKKARRLHWDVLPQVTDQYLAQLSEWEGQDEEARRWNPSFFYFPRDRRPLWKVDLDYSLIRNLVVCMGTADPTATIRALRRYDARVDDAQHRALLEDLVRGALAYDRDFEASKRERRPPPANTVPALTALADALDLAVVDGVTDRGVVQNLAYAAARSLGLDPKELFMAAYRGLIGQDRGPRFGSFALALGLSDTATRLRDLCDPTLQVSP